MAQATTNLRIEALLVFIFQKNRLRRGAEKLFECGCVLHDGCPKKPRVETNRRLIGVESKMLAIHKVVLAEVAGLRVGKVGHVQRNASTDKPGKQPMQHHEKRFIGEASG